MPGLWAVVQEVWGTGTILCPSATAAPRKKNATVHAAMEEGENDVCNMILAHPKTLNALQEEAASHSTAIFGSTTKFIPARLWSQLQCNPSNSDKQQCSSGEM